MKLILPIAGVGQRLRPFSFSKPKAFIQIAGLKGVEHILIKIGKDLPKNSPLCLITGYKSRQIIKFIQDHYGEIFQVGKQEQIPAGYQGDIPFFGGLGQAILISKEWYNNTEDKTNSKEFEKNSCLIFLSDMIPINDYSDILNSLKNPNIDGVIGTMLVPDDKTHFYGIVETNKEQIITSLIEKPEKTIFNEAIAGIYAFKPKTMIRLYKILESNYQIHIKIHKNSSKNIEFQFTPSLQQLIDEGFKLKSNIFREGILDFGRPEALILANKKLLQSYNSKYQIEEENLIQSKIKNPCNFGKNTKIIRSVIGPYVSIGKNCVLEDCNLENVIIGDNCILKKIITSHSIIGDNVKIDSIIKKNITLGDNSTLLEL